MVFAYLVKIKLRSAADLPTFLELFEPLRLHCNDGTSEPNTLTYEVLRDESCERTIMIIERYKSREDLEVTHRASEPFQKFCSLLGPLDIIEEKSNAKYFSELLPSVLPFSSVQEENANDASTKANNTNKGSGCLVFCGSRDGARPAYLHAGAQIGAGLARRGKTLVYGGGTVGIMGALARAAADNNGRVQSVIPRALLPREVSGDSIGQVFVTSTMSERKSIMFALSDSVIALPGGLGTFDELLETLTLFQLNAYRPRIGLLNVAGFFTPFMTILENMIAEGFVESHALKYFIVRDDAEELLVALLDDEAFGSDLDQKELSNLTWTGKP
jgi:cytokinin riboside 5'-monophosphate phosphoribohydrolase